MMERMDLRIEIDKQDLIDSLCDLSQKEARDLIVEMDRRMADYDFTLSLARHLVSELRKGNDEFELGDLE